jgi:hypothetical protein
MKSKFSQILLLTLLAFASSSTVSNAQSVVSDLSRVLSADMSQPVVNYDTTFNVTVVIQLSDTLNIQSLNLSVGTTLNNADFFTGMFDFQALTGPVGTTIMRTGYTVEISLGALPVQLAYFYGASLLDFQSNSSAPYIKQL